MTGNRPGRIVVTIPDALNSDLREVTASDGRSARLASTIILAAPAALLARPR